MDARDYGTTYGTVDVAGRRRRKHIARDGSAVAWCGRLLRFTYRTGARPSHVCAQCARAHRAGRPARQCREEVTTTTE